MRTILTQDHATNLRDLILNYGLDSEDARIIDFSYGRGSYWRTDYQYRCKVTKTDAVPNSEDVIKKNLFDDDYSDLGEFAAGIFDPPYLYGHPAFDYGLNKDKGVKAESWAVEPRFTQNKNEQDFINRVIALNRVAKQCIRKEGLLFVKVMDTRHKTKLVLNHCHIINNLPDFECWAMNVYVAGGAKTWKSHSETSHGYWMVFKRK